MSNVDISQHPARLVRRKIEILSSDRKASRDEVNGALNTIADVLEEENYVVSGVDNRTVVKKAHGEKLVELANQPSRLSHEDMNTLTYMADEIIQNAQDARF